MIITDLPVLTSPTGQAQTWQEAQDTNWSPEVMLDFFRRSAHPNFDAHVNGISDLGDDFLERRADENVAQYYQRVILGAQVQNTTEWKATARRPPAIAVDAPDQYARTRQPPPLADGGRRLVDVPYVSTSDSVHGIQRLLSPIAHPRPPQMQSAETWLQACMPHPRLQDGWVGGTSWRLLLLGGIGSGSSLHDDHIPSASWQVQLTGAKSWVICPPDRWGLGAREGRGILDIFAPDYDSETLPSSLACAMGTVHAGEMAWYPAKWLHATVNTESWSLGFTGSEVELGNVEAVASQMEHKMHIHKRTAAQDGEVGDQDMVFMPHTYSARQLAPRCFQWWREGLSGTYSSAPGDEAWESEHTCTQQQRDEQLKEALRVVEKNSMEDDAELESVAS